MNIEIRKAILADADSVYSLLQNFATSFKPQRKIFDNSLQHLLGDDAVLLNVAVSKNEVVAYCLAFDHYAFYANGRVSWVEEITVREDLRGKGIGKALMESTEQWAASRKSKLVALATRRAAPFYNKIGYEESAIYFRKIIDGSNG